NKFGRTSALAEVQTALVVVVTPASQLDPVDGRLAAEHVRIDVMELHEAALVAAMAAGPDEGASPEIPHPDGTLHLGGRRARPWSGPSRTVGLLSFGEPLLRQIHEQDRERAVQDSGVIAGGNGVA